MKYTVRDLIPKIRPFVKPFLGLLVLSFITNLVFSVVNATVLAVIDPVFRTLFGGESTGGIQVPVNVGGGIKAWFDEFIFSVVIADDFYTSIRNLSIFIFVLFTIRAMAKYFGRVISVRIEEGMMKDIRDTLFLKVTSLSMDFFSKKKTGDIMSLLTNDVGVLNNATISSMTNLWRETTTAVIYMAILFAISAKLTLIAVSISVVGLLMIRLSTTLLRRYGRRMQAAQANYTSTLQESLLGIRVIKALGVEREMSDRFADQTRHFVRTALRNVKISGLVPVVNDTFGIIALVGVFYAGAMTLAAGDIEPSSLITFLFLLFGLMQPITSIVSTITGMQRGIAAAENVAAILDEVPTIRSGEAPSRNLNSEIEFRNVSFSYGSGEVLRDISFKLVSGETIALVGASGSGKSTLLDLVLRFYDATKGEILVDGQDIRTLELTEYRKKFGMVSQETILFNDSVRNNISLGFQEAGIQRIVKAAEIAHADEFIQRLPEGYDTSIGDRGTRLSGGQRQRLAIARAVVRDPQILLFDEATSALDTESERIVQEAIGDVLKDRTAIVVAHRLSTIVNADRILVFDDGRLVEVGPHSELLAHDGVYAKLHALQFTDDSKS